MRQHVNEELKRLIEKDGTAPFDAFLHPKVVMRAWRLGWIDELAACAMVLCGVPISLFNGLRWSNHPIARSLLLLLRHSETPSAAYLAKELGVSAKDIYGLMRYGHISPRLATALKDRRWVLNAAEGENKRKPKLLDNQ